MNYRAVISRLGLLVVLLSIIMWAMCAVFFATEWALQHEVDVSARMALLMSGGLGLVVGGVGWLATRKSEAYLGRREAMLLVAASWLIGAAFAALPFYLWGTGVDGGHAFGSYVDCYFEATSGLTTTGATILPNIESVPDSLLLWRSMTHWLGGLGIVVLFVAVLPSLGVGGKRLFQVEAPGPSPEGVRPHIRETARVLWYIYLAFTVFAIVAYKIAGMPFFDAVCHAFSSVSTGGFSTKDASIGAFNSLAVDLVTIAIMLMAGINFGLYYQATKGKLDTLWKDTELRVYVVMKIVLILIVTVSLLGFRVTSTTGEVYDASAGNALRHATFTTMAQHTGTGFGRNDYVLWPVVTHAALIGLMFVGGCAGSTAGGAKVIRFWIALKVMYGELEKSFRPNVVRPLRVGGRVVDPDLKIAACGYVLGLLAMFIVGAILIGAFEPANSPKGDVDTVCTASLATVCNVGPGLSGVGAVETYAEFTPASKLVMTFLMALGRLEMFALLVLFVPSFWKRD